MSVGSQESNALLQHPPHRKTLVQDGKWKTLVFSVPSGTTGTTVNSGIQFAGFAKGRAPGN